MLYVLREGRAVNRAFYARKLDDLEPIIRGVLSEQPAPISIGRLREIAAARAMSRASIDHGYIRAAIMRMWERGRIDVTHARNVRLVREGP